MKEKKVFIGRMFVGKVKFSGLNAFNCIRFDNGSLVSPPLSTMKSLADLIKSYGNFYVSFDPPSAETPDGLAPREYLGLSPEEKKELESYLQE